MLNEKITKHFKNSNYLKNDMIKPASKINLIIISTMFSELELRMEERGTTTYKY